MMDYKAVNTSSVKIVINKVKSFLLNHPVSFSTFIKQLGYCTIYITKI